ncbi:uncharacterized protein LOC143242583 isoform X2 [Tachypleus tridentatus]|uniref:uncharacterized protein LOC143242583 isoform X2 n=1 Tax=Tachypleus tridentatus TaxID=6853 RepID=UPI003FD5F901
MDEHSKSKSENNNLKSYWKLNEIKRSGDSKTSKGQRTRQDFESQFTRKPPYFKVSGSGITSYAQRHPKRFHHLFVGGCLLIFFSRPLYDIFIRSYVEDGTFSLALNYVKKTLGFGTEQVFQKRKR